MASSRYDSSALNGLSKKMWVSIEKGNLLGCTYNEDYRILGSRSGPPSRPHIYVHPGVSRCAPESAVGLPVGAVSSRLLHLSRTCRMEDRALSYDPNTSQACTVSTATNTW